MNDSLPVLALLVPCYNEEEILNKTVDRLISVLEKGKTSRLIHPDSWICLINDGSKDGTWPLIERLHDLHPEVRGISLSRNFGHQNALWCALCEVEADLYVSIDADLQDDENAILKMVEQYHGGYDIVYGVRQSRKTDTFFKRISAQWFYRLMSWLGTKCIYNHADYRLMSHRAVQELRQFREVHIYLRGIVPLVGFPSTCVYYDRKARELGESKYPLGKMMMFAWSSLTSFSNFPLHLSMILGGIVCCGGGLLLLWSFICWVTNVTITGWFSLIGVITVLGGVQLLMMGMIGEYIASIFEEVKGRPKYIIQKRI